MFIADDVPFFLCECEEDDDPPSSRSFGIIVGVVSFSGEVDCDRFEEMKSKHCFCKGKTATQQRQF